MILKKHYIFALCFFLFAFGRLSLAQQVQLQPHNYATIGLHFSIPSDWVHDGLSTTTKAAFIKQFGWIYDKPDAEDIWNAVGRFSSIAVDSTLIPSDSAYTIHRFVVFVNRANTMYKRWLCLHRRSSFFEARPLVYKDHILTLDERIGPFDLPDGLSDARGRSYEYYTNQLSLPTIGHVFNFIHQDKCFEIKLESTSAHLVANQFLHTLILDSIKLVPF